jgi:quinoprotein glucose dehydrogenase
MVLMKLLVTLLFVLATTLAAQEPDWQNYGNDPGGMRYSTAAQINRSNVVQLKPAWTFHTGDISDGGHG